MSVLLSIPIFSIIAILQSAVVSRMSINQGTADLMMVVLIAYTLQRSVTTAWQWGAVAGILADFFSGLPFGIYTISYLSLVGMGVLIRERVWRFSFLMQLLLVLIGTGITHGAALLILFLQGVTPPLSQVISVVTLPSLVLNFMISLPVYLLTQDILLQLSPEEAL